MKTLQITEQTARKLYTIASAEFKAVLEDTFGKDFFSMSIMDRIRSVEDACAELGQKPVNEPLLRDSGFTEDEIIYRKLKIVTKALNENWEADYEDPNQKKWFPWFSVSSGAFVFGDANYAYSYANAGGASRLCFKSEELAEYAGKQFIELYKKFIL
ncbi:MAG: hypothetical protein FWC34_10990 [Bacteroidetes bacterium]|nr:hypothetical protein [Bacteroidota bacterium]MCL2302933.1 hypothetical protein [Lentimicrobiaceae bacterium]